MTRDVLFLIQCGPTLGMGHWSRSRELARQMAARGASVRFALTTPDCMGEVTEFPAALAQDTAPTNDLLIIDGYRITPEQAAPFAQAARLTALIDDTADRPRPCDVVINFQLYADACDYSAYPASRRIMGPAWIPLRPGFAPLRADNDRAQPRVLLSFGGGVSGEFGLEAARALAGRFDGPIDLALGAMGPSAADLPGNVTATMGDMAAFMRRATLYAGGLGTTFMEALTAGLPCVGYVYAPDQILQARAAADYGVPSLDTPDADRFADMVMQALEGGLSTPGPAELDGRGAARLAEALLDDANGADSG